MGWASIGTDPDLRLEGWLGKLAISVDPGTSSRGLSDLFLKTPHGGQFDDLSCFGLSFSHNGMKVGRLVPVRDFIGRFGTANVPCAISDSAHIRHIRQIL